MNKFLDYIKNEVDFIIRNKKNLTTLLLLAISVLVLQLTIQGLRNQQIIKSRATSDPIVFVPSSTLEQKGGKWVTTKPQVALELTSPLGNPGDPVAVQSQQTTSGTTQNPDLVSCNSNGGSFVATFNWASIANVTSYVIRINHEPADWGPEGLPFDQKDNYNPDTATGNGDRSVWNIPTNTVSLKLKSGNYINWSIQPAFGTTAGAQTNKPAFSCNTTTTQGPSNFSKIMSVLPKGLAGTAYAVDKSACVGSGKSNEGDHNPQLPASQNCTWQCVYPLDAEGKPDKNRDPYGGTWVGDCVSNADKTCDVTKSDSFSYGGSSCLSCIKSTYSQRSSGKNLITEIKKLNFNGFDICSEEKLVRNWCGGGVGDQAANDCKSIMTTCGSACALLPKPTGLKVTCSGNQATFTWNAIPGTGSYLLRFGKQGNNWKDVIHGDAGKTVTGTSFAWSTTDCIAEKDASGNNINVCFSPTARYNWTIQPFAPGEQYPSTNPQSDGVSFNCSENQPSPPAPGAPGVPTPTTKKYRIAESRADLTKAEWTDYDNASHTNPVTIAYSFKDQNPGGKFIFVEFQDSAGKMGGCGENKTQPCSVEVKLLGEGPTITSCSLIFESNNSTVLNLTGTNFGTSKGKIIKTGETAELSTREWKNTSVKAVWPNAPEGQVLPVTLTNSDGQSVEGQCSSIATLALGAKVFCRAPSANDTANVDLVLVGDFPGGTKIKQKVTIDKEGLIQGLAAKLEAGKNYILSLKAPKSLRKTINFTAAEGVTTVPNFILPVGDIFPADGGDGAINALDKGELNRQWIISADATGRSGDFNKDGRVNSIDWACMRYDFGTSDGLEPIAPITGGVGVGSSARQ